MRVLSVNAGLPREVPWKRKPVTTGIYKEPVGGPVRIRTLNLDGGRQADLRVHGGWDKAVYAYPSEFYELWRRERPELRRPSSGDRTRSGPEGRAARAPRSGCIPHPDVSEEWAGRDRRSLLRTAKDRGKERHVG